MKIILTIFSVILNWIPKSLLFAAADALGGFAFSVVRFRRQVVLENLRLAFGKEKNEAQLLSIAKKNYQHYVRVLVEILLSISWKRERYLQETVPKGFEAFEAFRKSGKGGFILTSHMGNWEFSIATSAALGLPLDVVVKESRTPSVEKFLRWFRRKTGAGILLETGTAKDILRSVSSGRFVAFILDQYMGAPIGLPVTFFGRSAGTAVALALMTDRKDYPIFVANNYRGEDGKIHIEVGPPINFGELSSDKNERLHQKTQIFNNVLEGFVRQNPEQWLWLHRRWKPFIGETRWPISRTSSVLAGLATALMLFACASNPGKETPTGIALPADPSIPAPALSSESYDATEPSSSPTPTPMPTPSPLAKKKTKKEKVKEEIKPAPSPVANKALSVVPPEKIPFEIGERVEMELKWTALPAGRAVLEVREGPQFNGRPTFHLWGNLLSSRIVDAVYHIDNTAESFIDRAGIMPYKFLLHMVESKQLKETRVAFDHVNGKAHYWAKRISERWGPQDIDRVDTLIPQARDMFSAVYYARALNHKIGKKQSFIVYENAQNWEIGLEPVATELIHTPVGAFQCLKIRVTANLQNVLTPMGDTFMWLSDDSKKFLVKFDTKIKIGSLYGILTKVKER